MINNRPDRFNVSLCEKSFSSLGFQFKKVSTALELGVLSAY